MTNRLIRENVPRVVKKYLGEAQVTRFQQTVGNLFESIKNFNFLFQFNMLSRKNIDFKNKFFADPLVHITIRNLKFIRSNDVLMIQHVKLCFFCIFTLNDESSRWHRLVMWISAGCSYEIHMQLPWKWCTRSLYKRAEHANFHCCCWHDSTCAKTICWFLWLLQAFLSLLCCWD